MSWKIFLDMFIAQALPVIMKLILDWLSGASEDEAVAVGKNLGKLMDAVKKEMA